MTVTLQEKNQLIRAAVEARMAATDPDDPKMVGYAHTPTECCDGGKCQPPPVAQRLSAHSHPRQSLYWMDANNRLCQLHLEKTAQYGGDSDPFENVTASAKCGVEPWRRALCDLSDCVVRMQKFAQGQPVDWENALLDAANWALICYVKLREAQP